jgi:hypothetical protein
MFKYYFLHIAKTGGTTFSKFLENFFCHSKILSAREQRDLHLYKFNNEQLVTGHFKSFRSFFDQDIQKIKLISFLRDPYKRYISQVKHELRDKKIKFRHRENTYFKTFLTNNSYDLNFKSGNLRKILKFNKIDKKTVKAVYNFVKKNYFIGITEKMDESMLLYCYNEKKRPINNTFFLNISDNDLKEHVCEKKFKNLNKYDYILYRLFRKNFNKNIDHIINKHHFSLEKYKVQINKFINLNNDFKAPFIENYNERISKKKKLFFIVLKQYLINCYSSIESDSKNLIEITASQNLNDSGWHNREYDKEGTVIPYKWSGPGLLSDIHISNNIFGKVKIKIYLNDFNRKISIIKDIVVRINGQILEKLENKENLVLIAEGSINKIDLPFSILTFEVPVVQKISEFYNNKDARLVGFAYNRIVIEKK